MSFKSRLSARIARSHAIAGLISSVLQSEHGRTAIDKVVWPGGHFRRGPDSTVINRAGPSQFGGAEPIVITYDRNDPLPIKIGKYCALNDHSYLMPGSNHRLDYVTTWIFSDVDIPISDQVTSKGPIVIGNDVLTGFDSLILSGVTIGDGAVIAARAVVTRDVPPYAIVAGTPAKVVGYRFDQPIRESLLRVAWWDWPHEVVRRHASQLLSANVADFVERHDPLASGRFCQDC